GHRQSEAVADAVPQALPRPKVEPELVEARCAFERLLEETPDHLSRERRGGRIATDLAVHPPRQSRSKEGPRQPQPEPQHPERPGTAGVVVDAVPVDPR